VAFSHDWKALASSSLDNTVKIWDVAKGVCLYTLWGHRSWVNTVVFSRDSKTLASALHNATVKIWDVVKGERLETLKGHSAPVTSVTFSHNSNVLASASHDATIKIWDVAAGEYQPIPKDNRSQINSVRFSRDSKKVLSNSDDGTLSIWDAATGECLATQDGPEPDDDDPYDDSAFNGWYNAVNSAEKPGGYGCVLNADQSWIIWHRQNGLELPPEYRPSSSAVSASGSSIAIGCSSGRVLVMKFSSRRKE
jgi:WD40 repeat protein